MVNDITAITPAVTPLMRATKWPFELTREVNDILDGGSLNYRSGYPAPLRACAVAALEAMGGQAEPVTVEHLVTWVGPVLAAVKNQRSPESFAAWFESLCIRMKNVPRGAFNEKSQRNAMDLIDFAPSIKEIVEAIEPWMTPINARLRALRLIIETPAQEAQDAA